MSEIKINHSSAIHECRRNYRLGSWVYAVLGLWMLLMGFTVFPETRPFTGIASAILGFLSIRSARLGKVNAAKYIGSALVLLGIMEWMTCFML